MSARERRLDERLRAVLRSRKPLPSPCPDAEQWIEFYSRSLEDDRVERLRDHLSECPACVELAKDALVFVESIRAGRPTRGARWPGRLVWALAAAAAMTAVTVLWVGRGQRTVPARPAARASVGTAPPEISIEVAEYPSRSDELVWRSGEKAPTESRAEAEFDAAMRSYVQRDWAVADSAISEYLAAHPGDARALFYRGVCLLQLRRDSEGAESLEAAARSAEGALREDVLWYLARARLRLGDGAEASRLLEDLARMGGKHAGEARAVLSRLPALPAP